MQSIDVVIIGAGVTGAAIAYELHAAGYQTAVLERGAEPAAGVSRASAGIMASGFDRRSDSLEVRLMREAAERWPQVFEQLAVPYRRTGAIALAADADDVEYFATLVRNARGSGIEVEPLDLARLRRLEPAAAGRAGLFVPEEAITDPFEVTRRLLGAVPVHYNARVLRVEQPSAQAALVRLESAEIAARTVVNCAGLYADEIADDDSFRIVPLRGDVVVHAAVSPPPLNHILRPARRERGVLVFPTIYGHVCAGPDSHEQAEKDDWRPRGLREVRAQGAALFPLLTALAPVDAWAGLRTASSPREFIIEWSGRAQSMLNVAAIRGTGLSACLGISAQVLRMFKERDIAPRGNQLAVQTPAFDAPRPWWERHNQSRGLTT